MLNKQELTCQIVTKQCIKMKRKERNHGKKRSPIPVILNDWLNFRVRGQFETKILIVRGHSDKHNILHLNFKKNQLEAAII